MWGQLRERNQVSVRDPLPGNTSEKGAEVQCASATLSERHTHTHTRLFSCTFLPGGVPGWHIGLSLVSHCLVRVLRASLSQTSKMPRSPLSA